MHRRGFFGFLAGLPFGVASTALAEGQHGDSIGLRTVHVTRPPEYPVGTLRDVVIKRLSLGQRLHGPQSFVAGMRTEIFDGERWLKLASPTGAEVVQRLISRACAEGL